MLIMPQLPSGDVKGISFVLEIQKMAKIKSLSEIAEKFATVTPQRAGAFAKGVEESTVDWAAVTAAAEGNYQDGVQKAILNKSFGAGVKKAGTAKWKEGVRMHGESRYAAGVAVAGPAYEAGFAPYHRVIESLTLPPRYARRDPRNIARVAAIATALGKAKESHK